MRSVGSVAVAALAALAISQTANAVVLCARQRPDGSYNTTVKIREACVGSETQLDTGTLGLQGPPGPQGPAGPEGPPLEVTDGIRFQNHSVDMGEVIPFAVGDGFFMAIVGGGAHYAFGHQGPNGPVVIIAQSGDFTTVQGTSGKFNIYSTFGGTQFENLFESGGTQVALGLFGY